MNDYRALFPYFGNNPFTTYLDSANTSQVLGETLDSLDAFYRIHNYNVGRATYAGARYVEELKQVATEKAASFLGAAPEQIIFTSGATEGLNMVAQSFNDWLNVEGKYANVLTTKLEHASLLLPWLVASRVNLCYAELNDDYTFSMTKFKKAIEEYKPAVVLLSSMTNTTGEIRPLKEIGELCSRKGIVLVIDHAQGAAHFSINVQDLKIDFLAFSFHKMYGTKGVGVLFAKNAGFLECSRLGGGMNQYYDESTIEPMPSNDRFYAGTINMPGIYANIHSIDFLMDNWANIQKIEKYLAIYARELLSRVPGINILSVPESPILLFKIENIEAIDIANELAERDICIRAGNHCAKLTPFGLSTCRVSLGVYNTPEELEGLYQALMEVTQCLNEQKTL